MVIVLHIKDCGWPDVLVFSSDVFLEGPRMATMLHAWIYTFPAPLPSWALCVPLRFIPSAPCTALSGLLAWPRISFEILTDASVNPHSDFLPASKTSIVWIILRSCVKGNRIQDPSLHGCSSLLVHWWLNMMKWIIGSRFPRRHFSSGDSSGLAFLVKS